MTYDDLVKAGTALFGAILFALFVNLVGDRLVSSSKPKVPGYAFIVAEQPAPKETPKTITVEDRLAKADPARGKELANVCRACHGVERVGGAKFGPNLYGVVGRSRASFPGFDYSDGMRAKGGKWTLADIDTFITSPKDFVSGTKMPFVGEPDAAKRADIIAYLRTLSDGSVTVSGK
jgi:cytochrome c